MIDILIQHGVPIGPVQTSEDIAHCPHLKARRMLLEIDDPIAGKRLFARSPVRMSKTKEVPAVPPPALGEHTETILKEWLKYSDREVQGLRSEKII